MKNNVKKAIKYLLNNSTFFVILIYVLSVLIIAPLGNYALADDYYYLVQIKAFSSGELVRSALIGPTFLAQNFLSVAWGNIFGFTYLSLRILTIFISIFCIFMVGNISDKLGIDKHHKLILMTLFSFNPYFYSCSLNLMTENYFLFFVLSSLYFFLLYSSDNKSGTLFISTLLGGLSIAVRQYGVVLFPAYLLFYLIKNTHNYKFVDIIKITVPFLFIGTIAILWPKYSSAIEPKSISINLFFAPPKEIISKIFSADILIYVSYFLMPISFSSTGKLNKKTLLFIILIALPISHFIFYKNVFTIGNLLYLEGLQARLRASIRESVFNNILFKIFLSYLISLSFTIIVTVTVSSVIRCLILKKKTIIEFIKNKDNLLLLCLVTAGFFLIVIVTEAHFDRYFINFFLFLTIIGILYLKKSYIDISPYSFIACILMSLITYGLVFDYHAENKLKWSLANKISEESGIKRYDIFIDQVYASTVQMEETNNFKGMYPARPQNYRPFCFIQEYSIQNESNFIYKFIKFINNKSITHKYFKFESMDIDPWNREKRNKYDTEDVLLYDEEYITPIYNLIGKKMYVRAFCTK